MIINSGIQHLKLKLLANMKYQQSNVVCLKNDAQKIPKELSKDLQNSYWALLHNEASDALIDEAHKIQKWNPVQLEASTMLFNPDGASKDGILKAIKEITFKQLKCLYLLNDKIQSLEPISRLRAPELQLINLTQNFITSTVPLRKLQSKHLEKIILRGNEILESDSLSETDWGTLNYIDIECYEKDQCYNIAFTTKLQIKQIQYKYYLILESDNRIVQKDLSKCLKQKYSTWRHVTIIQNKHVSR